jgi:hypothetical protein
MADKKDTAEKSWDEEVLHEVLKEELREDFVAQLKQADKLPKSDDALNKQLDKHVEEFRAGHEFAMLEDIRAMFRKCARQVSQHRLVTEIEYNRLLALSRLPELQPRQAPPLSENATAKRRQQVSEKIKIDNDARAASLAKVDGQRMPVADKFIYETQVADRCHEWIDFMSHDTPVGRDHLRDIMRPMIRLRMGKEHVEQLDDILVLSKVIPYLKGNFLKPLKPAAAPQNG